MAVFFIGTTIIIYAIYMIIFDEADNDRLIDR